MRATIPCVRFRVARSMRQEGTFTEHVTAASMGPGDLKNAFSLSKTCLLLTEALPTSMRSEPPLALITKLLTPIRIFVSKQTFFDPESMLLDSKLVL